MNKLFASIIMITVLLVGCGSSQTQTQQPAQTTQQVSSSPQPSQPVAAKSNVLVPPAAQGYHLVFSDDFTNFDLSPDGKGAHTWYKGVWFMHNQPRPENIQTSPNGLDLYWTRGQDGFDTSISTFSRNGTEVHAWRYGYIEVRMKWDPVRGAWPAVWLIPTITGHTKDSGELDVFEGVGEYPGIYFGTIHHWQESPDNPAKMIDVENSGKRNRFPMPPRTDVSQYHTYGMLWEPDKVTWFLDDQPLHTERSFSVFDTQYYGLILGMQEGSNWKPASLEGVEASRIGMHVQWVHVWQKTE